jgi:hypothetical protein
LGAKNSYPIIKKAFEADKVDVTIVGDLEDVELEWGLRGEQETFVPDISLFPADIFRSNKTPFLYPPTLDTPPTEAEVKRDRDKAKKEKNKKKQQKISRKKNQKKK